MSLLDPKRELGRDTRRSFTQTQKSEILAQQNNKCAECKDPLDPRAINYHHIKPWGDKGRTKTQNGVALCLNCHGKRTHSERLKKVDKRKEPKRESGSLLSRYNPPKLV